MQCPVLECFNSFGRFLFGCFKSALLFHLFRILVSTCAVRIVNCKPHLLPLCLLELSDLAEILKGTPARVLIIRIYSNLRNGSVRKNTMESRSRA